MSLPTPYYQSEKVTLYCGDCLSILPHLSGVDAVVTDPPYGIGESYASFNDDRENVRALVARVMPEILRVAPVAALTPGNGNQPWYPVPAWTLAWVEAAGAGANRWGFTCWQPVLVYGKCPHLKHGLGLRPDVFIGKSQTASATGHPCPKPIGVMEWMVDRATAVTDTTILDPFMGSGTTGVAAVRLGRKFIGIEIDEGYCAIAKRRIQEAEQAFALFEPTVPEVQAQMFTEEQ